MTTWPREGAEPSGVRERLELLLTTRNEIIQSLQTAAEQAANFYNQSHKDQTFAPGELSRLSSKNITTKRPSKRLDNKRYGPFEVLERIGAVAYRPKLPDAYTIHDVFHVSLLEPYTVRPGEEVKTLLRSWWMTVKSTTSKRSLIIVLSESKSSI